MIGRTIGGYRIESLLGQGGMGSVYRGTDLMLDRPVAIKALRADIAASSEHVERFRQEAKTLGRLLDPHIATLYALLREGDDLYMVMEFVEGETFEALLQRERWLPADRALELFDQVLRGIGHAHRRGIVHRDVKPANFMLMPSGTVKVMDFGIARLLGSARMTQTKHAIGTAEYMAPEQVRAREVDARTDIYALGVLLYEMVTGHVPFEAPSAFEVMQAHLQTPAPSPRRLIRDLPDGLEDAIARALAKNPEDRFESVDDFRAALVGAKGDGARGKGAVATSRPGTREETRSTKGAEASTGDRPRGREEAAAEPDATSSPVSTPAPPLRGDAEDNSADLEGDRPPAPPTVVAASRTEPPSLGDEGEATDEDAKRPAPPPTVVATVPDLEAAPPTRLATRPFEQDVETGPPPTIEVPRRAAPPTVAAPTPLASEPQPQRRVPRVVAAAVGLALLVAAGLFTLQSDPEVVLEDEPTEEPSSRPSPLVDAAGPMPGVPTPDLAPSTDLDAPGLEVVPAHPTPVPDNPAAEPPPPSRTPATVTERPSRPAPSRPEPIVQRPDPTPTPPPAPRTGTARILVRPFGDVYVDGRRLARETNAPVTADLEAGTYTVRATHPVFGELTETVTVRAGRTSEVRLQFATPVEVTVTSDVLNAEILLDGRRTGRYTPAVVTVPPGTHTITAEHDGRTSSPRTVTIANGRSPGAIRLTFPD